MFSKIIYEETHLLMRPRTLVRSFQDLVTNRSASFQVITEEVTFESIRNHKKAFQILIRIWSERI